MQLTSGQYAALKAAIAANSGNTVIINGSPTAINVVPVSPDNCQAVADWYNLASIVANSTIWKKLVPLADIAAKINGTELAGLTSLNHTRLQTIITLINAAAGLDASMADQRQFFDDIFSGAGGTNTRSALLILWKKIGTNAENLAQFSTGTGSDASPKTTASNIGMNFLLSGPEVQVAMQSP